MLSSVEQIKSRLSTFDVVGSYIKLQRAGANFKAICPFHTEKTPSFSVSTARDSWHCFGCAKGGDQFAFVMEIEGVDFKEALEILAKRAGVELTYERPEERSARARLFALMEEATRFYEAELPRNPMVIEYLKKRGVTEASIKNFRLGYALPESQGWRTFADHARKKGYTDTELDKVGLVIRKEPQASSSILHTSSFYDRFRNRIMFPIADPGGRVVGFSARIFGQQLATNNQLAAGSGKLAAAPAKYINTPQTALYDKSRVLYAFDKARVAIRRENTAILVEGQMDALMAHQSGTEYIVAVSGTALTSIQLQAIHRLADKLLMCFDMDEAGESATRRSIDLALKGGFEVQIIGLEAKDPADVIRDNPEEWAAAVKGAKEVVAFFLGQALAKYDVATAAGKRAVSSATLSLIAAIPRSIEKSHWVSRLAAALGVKEEAVWEDMARVSASASTRRVVPQSTPAGIIKSRLAILEERLLGLLLLGPTTAFSQIAADTFQGSLHQEVYTAAAGLAGATDRKVFLAGLTPEGQALANRLMFEAELTGLANFNAEVELCFSELKRERIKSRLGELSTGIREAEAAGDGKRISGMVDEFTRLSRELAIL